MDFSNQTLHSFRNSGAVVVPSDGPYPLPTEGLNSSFELWSIKASSLRNTDEFLLVQLIQGISARKCPSLIIDDSSRTVECLLKGFNITITELNSLPELVTKFKDIVDAGYVFADAKNAESMLAGTAIASVRGLVLITNATKQYAIESKLVVDASRMSLQDAWNLVGPDSSKKISILQSSKKLEFLVDYAAYCGAFVWSDYVASKALQKRILKHLSINAAVFGWPEGDEGRTVRLLSSESGSFIHAADWARNLSIYGGYGENGPWFQKSYIRMLDKSVDGLAKRTHKVCFLFTDGDNIQFLLGGFFDQKWYGSPKRGEIPLGWTLSPALARLNPALLQSIFRDASPNDQFVAAPSGIGYINLDLIHDRNNREAYCNLTADYMRKSGLHIVNVISDGDDVESVQSLLHSETVDAVFYYEYSAYQGLGGMISIDPETRKPIIGARYQLWKGTFDSIDSLALKLNKMSTNPHSEDGYSLIPVNIWQHSVEDVVNLVERLDKQKIQIVGPDVFVKLISENVRLPWYRKCPLIDWIIKKIKKLLNGPRKFGCL
jgi:hypothetical protein